MATALPRDTASVDDEAQAPVRACTTDTDDRSGLEEPMARDTGDRGIGGGASWQAASSTTSPRRTIGRLMAGAGKHLATLGIALVAVWIAIATWEHYVTAPLSLIHI